MGLIVSESEHREETVNAPLTNPTNANANVGKKCNREVILNVRLLLLIKGLHFLSV